MCIRPTVALSVLLLATVISRPASANVRIRIDQTNQRLSVAVDGQRLYDWPVSTGLPGHNTPNGSFRALRLERTYFSRKYDNVPMPHAVFFTGYCHAIHGTNHVRQLGRAASHGCVRLSPSHAAALFSLIKAEGTANTRITIGGSELLVASRKGRAFRAVSRQPRFQDDGTMPAGMQMESAHGDDGLFPLRPAYRLPSYRRPSYAPYGYGADEDDFE